MNKNYSPDSIRNGICKTQKPVFRRVEKYWKEHPATITIGGVEFGMIVHTARVFRYYSKGLSRNVGILSNGDLIAGNDMTPWALRSVKQILMEYSYIDPHILLYDSNVKELFEEGLETSITEEQLKTFNTEHSSLKRTTISKYMAYFSRHLSKIEESLAVKFLFKQEFPADHPLRNWYNEQPVGYSGYYRNDKFAQAVKLWLGTLTVKELLAGDFLDEWTWQKAVKSGIVLGKVGGDE